VFHVSVPLGLCHKIRLTISTKLGRNHTNGAIFLLSQASLEAVLADDHRSGAAGSDGRLMNRNLLASRGYAYQLVTGQDQHINTPGSLITSFGFKGHEVISTTTIERILYLL